MNITINIPQNAVDSVTVASKNITIYFPVQESTIVTVIEKGVLFGIQGPTGATGPQGSQGIQGIPGIGIAAGGSIGQVLVKTSATDYITGWLILDKTAVGLSSVDNTTDLLKPISTATQTALNLKQASISLTTTGSSGASTFAANVLNIPTYSLSGLGGQPLATNLTSISALTFASTSFVKMTAAGTFALDTNTYLTAEADTLASVTGRGATTTTAVTMAKLTLTGAVSGVGNLSSYTVTAASGSAISKQITSSLVASANGDTLVGLDINPTFTVGSFTGTTSAALRVAGNILASTHNAYDIGTSNIRFKDIWLNGIIAVPNAYINTLNFGVTNFNINNSGGTAIARWFGTGNLTLQNGGTFTDAGFRLDVVGADSRFNGIRAGLGAGQVAGNTVFGNGALGSNSVGVDITAIGAEALKVNTANNNTAVGHWSLRANTTGAGNTAIGRDVMVANLSGQNNTIIGVAGISGNTTGSNNTGIGFNIQSGNFSGSVILGSGATATASNQFVVGSTGTIAGAVTTATAAQTKTWDVIINGVAQKILLA